MKNQSAQDKLAWHLLNSYPTSSLKEYLAYNSYETTQQDHQSSNHFQTIEIPISHQSNNPAIEVQIQLGDGKPKVIKIYNRADIEVETQTFCRRHKLSNEIKQLLIESIREKYEQFGKQKDIEDLLSDQYKMKEVYSHLKPHQVLLNMSSPQQLQLQQPLFQQASHNKSSLLNSKKNINNSRHEKLILKSSCPQSYHQSQIQSNSKSQIQYLRNTKNQNKQNQPQINKLSQQICNMKGKQTILQQRNKRSKERLRVLLKQKQQRQQQIMKQCQFRPKINNISKKVDRQLQNSSHNGHTRQQKKMQRYQILYENYKQIQSKRQQIRKNSLMQIPFKPSINLISKRIIQNKRQSQDHCHLPKETKSHHCSHEELKYQPKTGRKPRNRNHECLPIGEYLYNQGMKKSKSKVKIHEQSRAIKASQHSDYLISILKQKRINQLFTELTSPPHQYLQCMDINLAHHAFKYGVYRYFMPIFNEMIELGISLSREEFLDASLRLFKILSPEEKHQVIFKKDKENAIPNQSSMKHNKSRQTLKSTSRLQGGASIYNRGVEHKKMINQRIQKSRQDKVRQQLKKCTFRPDIHRLI